MQLHTHALTTRNCKVYTTGQYYFIYALYATLLAYFALHWYVTKMNDCIIIDLICLHHVIT